MFRFLSVTCFAFLLSGCSVMMAASEQQAPDTSVLRQGATRNQIEHSLGRPIKYVREWNYDRAVYQYITNDQKNYKRAATYAVLDGLTLGAAELFTFGMEAVQGDRHEIEVLYDRRGNALQISETVIKAPIDKPEKVFGIDKDEEPTMRARPKLPTS